MQRLDDLFGLAGRRALVTGASSGLGVEFAEALAIAGADVVLVARREDRLREVAGMLSAYPVKTGIVPADLSDLAAIGDVFTRAEAALGPIDIIVNNAGIADPGRAEKLSLERWQRMLDLNLTQAFLLSQELARRLIERKAPGRIVNVSSVLGAFGSAVYRLASYTAAKGALENLTRQLAIEWGAYGITVNSLAPGWFPTEMTGGGLEKGGNRERMELFTPLGRLGKPEEVRAALLYLVSPAATYVTGSTVYVDGGYSAW